ncbi:Nucleotide-binding, alpha-beta plait [Cordyceps fumosorosea ARSEF 2679]|uniref:Nucleotide-binding, alpha-beta plait n=1 Tax=Cordyceps fumosorosea (strain ARSEF 2679) TaxID=1081104 RepID=A0A168EBH9_CORFA|nr:Nucleotide-binding, alpha-beta plait [Cordyceps fumosorosea ARSEF 2679]OAA73611.1 Nucleotide-binding, alpha-beta plait [Cordyceps fumosorosea ARSEF 2679]
MTDQQEPEIHATAASLSPVSPSPVHTAAPLVVPALQDTVDTIEAMAAAVADAPDTAIESMANPTNEAAQDEFVDDDSLDGAYVEDSEPQLPNTADSGNQDPNDDYAKMFDSPAGSDQAEEDRDASVDVSAAPATVSQPRSIQAQNDTASSPVSASGNQISSSAPVFPASQPAAQSLAGHDTNVPALEAVDATAASPTDAHPDAQPSEQVDTGSALNFQADEPHGSASPSAIQPSAIQPDGQQDTTSHNASPTTLASTSSLPPRPPVLQPTTHSYGQISSQGPVQTPQTATGAPRNLKESGGTLPLAPEVAHGSSAPSAPQTASAHVDHAHDEYQRLWDQFIVDERQYMSEAKWDRFPEGSRLFIGNLSSDKVSKRDVFEIFHRYGRLAQISLKSAYGFVQYHTVEEGKRAIQNLEGFEIKGRRIHLEASKLQDKSKKERNKSPERGGRGRDAPRKGDKYHDRDDRRGSRHHSPRRQGHHGRDDSYGGRDKFHDSSRGRDRSRSPGYGRHDKGRYRQRSNSPYGGRSRHQDKEIDLPSRYGADVPDIQIIIQQEVHRDFLGWVEQAFRDKGLRAESMYLKPRFPKDKVIQRQAAEGVHAVVELDMRAQNLGKIPVQVFDRSSGSSNVRFDQYVDLDPATAGEVVLRAKASAAAATAAVYTHQPYGSYQQPYQPPVQQHPPRGDPYGGAAHPPAAYAQPLPAAGIPAMADVAKLVGQVDNATLQRVLSAMAATPPSNAIPAAAVPQPGHAQVDIQALLGALGSNPAAQAPPVAPAAAHYGGAYGSAQAGPPHHGPRAPSDPVNGDSAAVQNIMTQLSRYRQ